MPKPAPGSCPGGSRAIDNKSAIAFTAFPPEPDLESKRGQRVVLASCNRRDSQSALDYDKYDFLRVRKYVHPTSQKANTFCKIEYSYGERQLMTLDDHNPQMSYDIGLTLEQEAVELNTVVHTD